MFEQEVDKARQRVRHAMYQTGWVRIPDNMFQVSKRELVPQSHISGGAANLHDTLIWGPDEKVTFHEEQQLLLVDHCGNTYITHET